MSGSFRDAPTWKNGAVGYSMPPDVWPTTKYFNDLLAGLGDGFPNTSSTSSACGTSSPTLHNGIADENAAGEDSPADKEFE
jgi:hypothetical protein